jgi:hypothetical protein
MASAVTLPPVSNREDWDETLQLFDPDTGEAFDLGAVTALTLVVWDPDSFATVLSGALNAGITITDSDQGVIAIHFAAGSMQALAPKNHAFRLGMTSGGATKDLILPGILPVEDGGP